MKTPKIYSFGKFLLGFAGTIGHAQRVIEKVKPTWRDPARMLSHVIEDVVKSSSIEEFSAEFLLLDKTGIHFVEGTGSYMTLAEPFAGISSCEYAVGALELLPKEGREHALLQALEIQMKHCQYVRPPFVTLSIEF